MESSIAEFVERQLACELLPTDMTGEHVLLVCIRHAVYQFTEQGCAVGQARGQSPTYYMRQQVGREPRVVAERTSGSCMDFNQEFLFVLCSRDFLGHRSAYLHACSNHAGPKWHSQIHPVKLFAAFPPPKPRKNSTP